MGAIDLGEFDARIENRLFHVWFDQVAPGIRADISEPVPFVHPELSHADLDVHAVVIVLVHIALRQMISEHILVDFLAALYFGNQPSSCFGECAQRIPEEVLPPLMLPIIRARWPSPCTDTHKNANISARPFVYRCFLEDLGCGIVRARPFIDEDMLTDLDRLEGKTSSRRGPSGLPNGAIELGWRFFAGVVRS